MLFAVTLVVCACTASQIVGQQPASPTPGAKPAVSGVHSAAVTSSTPSTAKQTVPPAAPVAQPQESSAQTDNVATQQPQIIVTSPAPQAQSWQWYERVAWAASIVLAVLGYVGIMLALRTLKNIERTNQSSLEAARAALAVAESSQSQTRALLESERPWILVSVEPSLTKENTFRVLASNRGRRPGRITHLSDQIHIVVDENDLPKDPGHGSVEAQVQEEPMVLLPGESLVIASFGRKDVAQICKTDDQLRQIAAWEATIFLFGRITYEDLTLASQRQSYESDWCCRYIHGETKSALLLGGPQAYNRHV